MYFLSQINYTPIAVDIEHSNWLLLPLELYIIEKLNKPSFDYYKFISAAAFIRETASSEVDFTPPNDMEICSVRN